MTINPAPANATVGQTITFTIGFFDQDGVVMAVTPTPDEPPTWTNLNPSLGTLSPAADNLSATELVTAVGKGTVQVGLSVSGTPFTASGAFGVSVAPQILTSIQVLMSVQ